MGAVIVAGRYVPRPPTDNIWDRPPSRAVPEQYLPAVVTPPFAPNTWVFKGDDSPLWMFWKYQQAGITPKMPVGGGFPFKPRRWAFDYQDTPVFYGRTFDVPVQLFPATSAAPFVPSRWKFDHIPATEWVGQPADAFWVLDQSFQLYVASSTRQIPPGNDPAPWAGNRAQTNNNLLVVQAVVDPLKPAKWRHYDEAPGLDAKSRAVPESYLPTSSAPLTPSRWKQDNDDAAVWYTKPGSINDVFMPLGGNFPFVPVRWRFDYDDASLWTVETFPKAPVQGLVNGGYPLKPTFWDYNNDDPGTWRGFPANVGIVQQLVIASPLLPTRWTRDYDQPAFWSGAPSDVPITITQPLPPIVPPAPEFDIPTPPINSAPGLVVGKRKKKKHVEPPRVIRRAVYVPIVEKPEPEEVVQERVEEVKAVKPEPFKGSLLDLAPLVDERAALKRKQQEEEEIALILLGFK